MYDRYLFGIGELITDPAVKNVAGMTQYNAQLQRISALVAENPAIWCAILIGLQQRLLIEDPEQPGETIAPELAADWNLSKVQMRLLQDAGWTEPSLHDQVRLIQWVSAAAGLLTLAVPEKATVSLNQVLDMPETLLLLKTNYYDGIQWFNKEAAETFEILLEMIGFYLNCFDESGSADRRAVQVMALKQMAELFHKNVANSGYHYCCLYAPTDLDEEVLADDTMEKNNLDHPETSLDSKLTVEQDPSSDSVEKTAAEPQPEADQKSE